MDEDRWQIPVKHRVVTLVWYADLDDYINGIFPSRKVNLQSWLEASQNTICEFSIEFPYDMDGLDAEMDRWLESPVPGKSWEEDHPNMSVEDFFHVLAKRKFWPEGEFIVHVWW